MSSTTALVNISGGIKIGISLRAQRNLLTQSFSDIFDVDGGYTCHTVIMHENIVFEDLIVVQ